MPRQAREKSETGIYHVIFRGTNRQIIFHDNRDRMRFLTILKKVAEFSSMAIYSWCLMGNHVHLLVKEGSESLSVSMKRISVSYVWYYHERYGTTGHFFQDRFTSEKVEREDYLLTVVRYIHQNPLKANLVKKMTDWPWSSCREYYGHEPVVKNMVATDCILDYFSDNRKAAIESFNAFNETYSEDHCLEDQKGRRTDREIEEEIKKLLPGIIIQEIKKMKKKERNAVIYKIKGIKGVSQRQIARILGVSPKTVFNAGTQ